ncbi:Restriction endonuclease [Candidatus Nanohalovita haloferacivicina]|nr:Restriction endonuclease [Candidatus Nanohalobia archaeon BNXNv]
MDDLSGYDFEDVMMDVYRNLGYENVRNPGKSGDEGRDILMEKDGRTYVVECKHMAKVGRPKVQKLHSAVSTYPNDATGILVTTGRFTKQAREYVEKVNNGDSVLELTNGKDLREMGEEIGLDLYSGKIEVLCDEVVDFPTERDKAERRVKDKFSDIRNFNAEDIDDITLNAELLPSLHVRVSTNATFETTVGVIHRVDERDEITIKADRKGPEFDDGTISDIVAQSMMARTGTVELDEEKSSQVFDSFELKRYGKTETEYKDEIKEFIKDSYEETVTYTGDNNVTYSKDCRPRNSDVSVESITPVYVPFLSTQTEIKNYSYKEDFYVSTDGDKIDRDEVHNCVHCGLDIPGINLTFCENCGSINCLLHTRMERVEEEPICTGCSKTERFFLRKRHFYNQENLEKFRKEFEERPLPEKMLENKPLIAISLMAMLLPFLI